MPRLSMGRPSQREIGSFHLGALAPATVIHMLREISSGGAVLHRIEGVWSIAVIEPRKDDVAGPIDTPEEPRKRKPKTKKIPLALPKGLVDPGEKPEQTALREVREETGIEATLITKLTDIKYVYVRTWSDSERVFKIVSFYLFRYESGRIDDVTEAMRIEVKRALWIPLADATKLLAYSNERKVVRLAEDYVAAHPEL